MTHTKHTPGPWTLKHFDECQTVVIGDGVTLAIVSVGEGRPNGEANARLIAAAPELLAAANLIHHAYASSTTNDELFQRISRPISVLLDAIAKAEPTP